MASAWLSLLCIGLTNASIWPSTITIHLPLPLEATFNVGDYVQFYVNLETNLNIVGYATWLSGTSKSYFTNHLTLTVRTAISHKVNVELFLDTDHNNSQIFILLSEPGCKTCYCDFGEIVKLYIRDIAHRDKPSIKEYNNTEIYLNTTECKAKPTLKILSGTNDIEVISAVTYYEITRVNLRCYPRFPSTTIYWINDETSIKVHEGITLDTLLPNGTKLSCVEVYEYEENFYTYHFTLSRSAVVQLIEKDEQTFVAKRSVLNISCACQHECPVNCRLVWFYKKESTRVSYRFLNCKCETNVPCTTEERNLTLTKEFNNALFYCSLDYNRTEHEIIKSYRITLLPDIIPTKISIADLTTVKPNNIQYILIGLGCGISLVGVLVFRFCWKYKESFRFMNHRSNVTPRSEQPLHATTPPPSEEPPAVEYVAVNYELCQVQTTTSTTVKPPAPPPLYLIPGKNVDRVQLRQKAPGARRPAYTDSELMRLDDDGYQIVP